MRIKVWCPKLSLTLTLEQNFFPFICLKTRCGMNYILNLGLRLLEGKAKSALSLSKKKDWVQSPRLHSYVQDAGMYYTFLKKGLVLGD